MRKLVAALAISLLAACGQGPAAPVAPERIHAQDFAALANIIASCASTPQWSIQEASNPGFVSPRDGVITQDGVFTAPTCASAYIGTTMHVVVTCSNLSADVAINVADEVVQVVAFYAATIGTGPSACLVAGSNGGPYPLHINLPIGGSYQGYAKVVTNCGHEFYDPPAPASWPTTVCP